MPPETASATSAAPTGAPRRFFRELESPRMIVSNITPNWFASVMGTGIVATAAATLPVQVPGLRLFAEIVWVIAALLLVVLTIATILHWLWFGQVARGHLANPVIAHFYGAPAMAALTVGAGAMLVGTDLIGESAAVGLDTVLWILGTILGVISAVTIPYLTFTRHEVSDQSAFGGWLMPVVPPMVSAATGALLLLYAPEGQARLTLLLACYAMFGLTAISSFVIITLIWGRLARHKVGAAAAVPTLWIVLGPLGQSVTAAGLLGANAHLVVDGAWAHALEMFGILYGVPVFGFALMWMGIVIAVTIRTIREGLPFSLTWWSFTFPVGTCVTGASALAAHTGSVAFAGIAMVLYLGLLAAWVIAAVRTFRGAVISGALLAPPRA